MDLGTDQITEIINDDEDIKQDVGVWRIVEEKVEEIGSESLGAVGVRKALVTLKQKQVSKSKPQLPGIVALKNTRIKPTNKETPIAELLSNRQQLGVVALKDSLNKLTNKENPKVELLSNPKQLGAVALRDSQNKPTNKETPKLELLSNSQPLGVVAVKNFLTKPTNKENPKVKLLSNPKQLGVVAVKNSLNKPINKKKPKVELLSNPQQFGAVTVKDSLNKPTNKEKPKVELLSNPQQFGVVALKDSLNNPNNKERPRVELLSNPNIRIMDPRGSMILGKNKQDNPDDEAFELSAADNPNVTNRRDSENIKKEVGVWRVVEEKVEEMVPEALGVIGVKHALDTLKQKQISKSNSQQLGIVAVKDSLTRPTNKEKPQVESFSNPNIGILGLRGSMISGENKFDILDDEASKVSPENDLNVTEGTTGVVGAKFNWYITGTSHNYMDLESNSIGKRETSRKYVELLQYNADPVNAEPVKLLPYNSEPVKLLPHNVEPVKLLPDNAEPVKLLPDNAERVEFISYNNKPVKLHTYNDEPVKLLLENGGPIKLLPQSELLGAKGTKYKMSFLTRGRRFSGDNKNKYCT